MAPVTKTRVSLSFVQKKAILEEVEKNLRSKTDIAKAYEIPKSSLSTILKAKENILKAGPLSGLPSARMRAREAKYPRKRLLPCVFCRDTLKTAMRTQ